MVVTAENILESTAADETFQWLVKAVSDPANEMSLGAFGAIGHFSKGPRLRIEIDSDRMIASADADTTLLEIRRHTNLQPIAFEILSSDPECWNHAIALCLPIAAAKMAGRTQQTALGPDERAIDQADRSACLYDLAFGTPYANICVRSLGAAASSVFAAAEHEYENKSELADGISPYTWIFETALGRLETRNTFRRHIMKNVLIGRADYATTTPIPEGLVPVGYLIPPQPQGASFSRRSTALACHYGFQDFLDRFGRPDLLHLKRRVEKALEEDAPPTIAESLTDNGSPLGRHEISSIRVTLRQRRWLFPEQPATAWEHAFDRALTRRQRPK